MKILNYARIRDRGNANWVIYAAVFSCSLLLLAIPIHTPINQFDEGITLTYAYRFSLGDFPYIDYWTCYMPGQHFAIGFLFSLFGPSVLVERWWDIVIRALFLLELFIFTRDKLKTFYSLFVWLVAALLLAGSGGFGNPVYPALLCSLTSVLMCEKYFRTNHPAWIFVAGLSVGLATWFRWDFGLFASIANFLALFFFLKTRNNQNGATRMNLRIMSIFFSGAMLATLLLVVLILIQGAFAEFINQGFVLPAIYLRAFRGKPYPTLLLPLQIFAEDGGFRPTKVSDLYHWLFFYFPILVSFFFSIWVFSGLRKKISSTQFFGIIAFAVFGLMLTAYSLSRFDYQHVIPVSLFICPLIFLLLASVEKFKLRPFRTLVFPLAATIISAIYLIYPVTILNDALVAYSPFHCFTDFPKARCIYLDPDQLQVVDYIDSVTDDTDPILIGNFKHDQILINDVSLYFLVGLPGATLYYEFEPGIITTHGVQEEIIADLKQSNVCWIVLVDTPVAEKFNQGSISNQVYLLDDYIAQNYRREKTFGRFVVLQAVP